MRVYIDANIYLRFLYTELMQSDLLGKFEKVLDSKSIQLLFPQITKDEFYRNSPELISAYSKKIGSVVLTSTFPPEIRDDEIYKQLKDLKIQYEKKTKTLQAEFEKYMQNFIKNKIEKLMSRAENINEEEREIKAAKLRRFKGNPPGSPKDPLGDEIVWELILSKCTDDDLTIISEDGGWRNIKSGKKDELHPFLQNEWQIKAVGRNISLTDSLTSFISSQSPSTVSKKDKEYEKEASMPLTAVNLGTVPVLTTFDYQNASRGSLVSLSSVNLGSLDQSLITRQPSFGAAISQVVRCVRCGQQFSSQDCFFTVAGYYCRKCYSSQNP